MSTLQQRDGRPTEVRLTGYDTAVAMADRQEMKMSEVMEGDVPAADWTACVYN